MDVLVAGPVPTNPSELLGSETMLKTIRQLENSYDIVFIDTPPVLPVADALLIGVNVDAVVVVARLGETTRDRVRRTTAALNHVKANVAGVVPNGAIEREDSAYSYAYRDRSKRLQPDSPYQASDPVIALHPNNLYPAFRADQGKTHEPAPKPDGAIVREFPSRTTRQARRTRAGPGNGRPGTAGWDLTFTLSGSATRAPSPCLESGRLRVHAPTRSGVVEGVTQCALQASEASGRLPGASPGDASVPPTWPTRPPGGPSPVGAAGRNLC